MFKAMSEFTLRQFTIEKLLKSKNDTRKTINIWTDGSLQQRNNFGVGMVMPTYNVIKNLTNIDDVMQYGFRLNLDNLPISFKQYNNVVCELFAAMFAIQYIRDIQKDCLIMLNYDYTGVENWITGAWDCKNELTKLYRAWFYTNELQYEVSFNKIMAHQEDSGNNDLADQAARFGNQLLDVELLKNYYSKDEVGYSRLVFSTNQLEVRCDWNNELAK